MASARSASIPARSTPRCLISATCCHPHDQRQQEARAAIPPRPDRRKVEPATRRRANRARVQHRCGARHRRRIRQSSLPDGEASSGRSAAVCRVLPVGLRSRRPQHANVGQSQIPGDVRSAIPATSTSASIRSHSRLSSASRTPCRAHHCNRAKAARRSGWPGSGASRPSSMRSWCYGPASLRGCCMPPSSRSSIGRSMTVSLPPMRCRRTHRLGSRHCRLTPPRSMPSRRCARQRSRRPRH